MKERIQALEAGAFGSLRSHWLLSSAQTVLDLLVLLTALILSYLLRFEFDVPQDHLHYLTVQASFVVLLQFVALTLAGGRNFMWRYTGIAHVRSFLYAALASVGVLGLLRLLLTASHQTWRMPVSINLVDAALAFGGTFALRTLRRAAYEYQERRGQLREYDTTNGQRRRPVLLIGAGQAGALAAKEIAGRRDLDLDIKGFVDDDDMKLGRSVVQRQRFSCVINSNIHNNGPILPKLGCALRSMRCVRTRVCPHTRGNIQRVELSRKATALH